MSSVSNEDVTYLANNRRHGQSLGSCTIATSRSADDRMNAAASGVGVPACTINIIRLFYSPKTWRDRVLRVEKVRLRFWIEICPVLYSNSG